MHARPEQPDDRAGRAAVRRRAAAVQSVERLPGRSMGSRAAVPGDVAGEPAGDRRDVGRHLVLLPAAGRLVPPFRSVRLPGAGQRLQGGAQRHGGMDAGLVAPVDLSGTVTALSGTVTALSGTVTALSGAVTAPHRQAVFSNSSRPMSMRRISLV